MGTSVCKAVAPFALALDLDFDLSRQDEVKDVPDVVKKAFIEYMDNGEQSGFDLGNGWLQTDSKEFKEVYPHAWSKGKFTVFSVNESQYSAGCGCEPTFFAKSEAALKAFKKDFKIKEKIEKNKAVVQFL